METEKERIEIETKATRKANLHWIWLEKVLGHIYIDAYVHGYKHGCKDKEKEIHGAKP